MLSACTSRFSFPYRQLSILLTVFSLSLFIAAPAHTATYYVSTNGSDSNPGSEAAPWRTIAHGSQKMSGGDTLLIRAGTYDERMVHGDGGFVFKNGTSKSNMTRFAAYPSEEKKVIIKPSASGAFVAYFPVTANYIELSGLTLDATNAKSYAIRFDYGSGGWSRNIRVIGNELRGGRIGIGGGGDSEIIGNEIHSMSGYGIYTGGDNGIVEGNIFHDLGGFALHLYQSSASGKTVNNWTIRNNIMYRVGRGYKHALTGDRIRTAPAVIISSGRNNKFYNNIIYDSSSGIAVNYGSIDSLIANNTVYGNDNNGISVYDGGGSRGTRVINNISYGNRGPQLTDNGTNTTLQNNLTTNPNFVNAAAGDFGVQASSPAIDKGLTLAEVTSDFTGKARPEGVAYDIGAFEGAGSKANVLPGMGGGLPPGGAGTGGSGGGGLGNCYK